MSRTASFRLVFVGVVGAVTLGGCFSSSTDAGAIQMDPTPELSTLYQRPGDENNMVALTINTNQRSLNQDLARFWLLNRPSLLTVEPMPR